jgi:adenine-specific DNA methylase
MATDKRQCHPRDDFDNAAIEMYEFVSAKSRFSINKRSLYTNAMLMFAKLGDISKAVNSFKTLPKEDAALVKTNELTAYQRSYHTSIHDTCAKFVIEVMAVYGRYIIHSKTTILPCPPVNIDPYIDNYLKRTLQRKLPIGAWGFEKGNFEVAVLILNERLSDLTKSTIDCDIAGYNKNKRGKVRMRLLLQLSVFLLGQLLSKTPMTLDEAIIASKKTYL